VEELVWRRLRTLESSCSVLSREGLGQTNAEV
jgi:hypothetical protein